MPRARLTRLNDIAPVQQGALDWQSNWNNGTGLGSNAVRATTPTSPGQNPGFSGFTATSGLGFMLEAVPKPTVDTAWPSWITNVLDVMLQRLDNNATWLAEPGDTMSCMLLNEGGWSQPAVGEFVYIYSYDCYDFPVGVSTNTHIVHYGSAGTEYLARWFANGGFSVVEANGDYVVDFGPRFNDDGSNVGLGQGNFRSFATSQTKAGRVIKRVVRLERVTSGTARITFRIYDFGTDPNIPIHDNTDYECMASGANGCISHGFRTDFVGQYTVDVANWAAATSLEIGNNGTQTGDASDPAALQHWYWGGLGVLVTSDSAAWGDPRGV